MYIKKVHGLRYQTSLSSSCGFLYAHTGREHQHVTLDIVHAFVIYSLKVMRVLLFSKFYKEKYCFDHRVLKQFGEF